jgi:2-keto-3-deoxy-L-rhamnonate aldolase RhmA
MTEVGFGQQLRQDCKLLGSWCTFASFASAEVMTHLGLDFVVLDLQHCEWTMSHFPAILGAFRNSKPVPVVRIPEVNYHSINWLFDQGVRAILAPMVNSVEIARKAVEGAKFPPVGKRSFGPYRAAEYSFGVNEYMPQADALATLIIQIESIDAARNIDDILGLPGVDAIFMGPNDLAFSMLREGESFFSSASGTVGAAQWTGFARTPEVMEVCRHVLRRCQAAGMPFGTTASSIEEAGLWLDQGAKFMTFGSDFLFMREGAKRLLTVSETEKG